MCTPGPLSGRRVALTAKCIFATAAFGLSFLVTAQPSDLHPRINDPFSAPTWRLAVDKAETMVAVGLANNTIALYPFLGDRSLHHMPIGDEENQRAHPVAISPNGEVLAYGVPPDRDENGWPRPNTGKIYILNRSDGRIMWVVPGLPSRAQDIRFSPDGQYLAAVLSSGCGLRVWRISDWSEFAHDDADYEGLNAPTNACEVTPPAQRMILPDTHALTFTGDPRSWLVTSGMTGIRIYRKTNNGVSLEKHKKPVELGLQVPDALALSPDGKRLAVGDRRVRDSNDTYRLRVVILDLNSLRPDGPALELRDDDLQFPERLDPRVHPDASQFNLSQVSWLRSEGQEWLLAAGAFPCIAGREALLYGHMGEGAREICAVLWSIGSAAPPRFLPVGTEQVVDTAPLPTKEAFLILSNRRLMATRVDGNVLPIRNAQEPVPGPTFIFDATAADFRDRPSGSEQRLDFLISDDASYVYFEDYRRPQRMAIRLGFDLKRLQLELLHEAPQGLRAAQVDALVTGSADAWLNKSTPPSVTNEEIGSLRQVRDIYRGVALLPNARVAIISANFVHIVGVRDGKNEVLCSRRIQSEGFRINASKDGTVLVIGHGDGVLRWYRIVADGTTSCTLDNILSVHLSQAEGAGDWSWVAWLPDSGEFAADGRRRNVLAWQIPDEKCNTRVVGFNVMTQELYDRQAVQNVLSRSSAGQGAGERLLARVLSFCDSSVLKVLSPSRKARVSKDVVAFEIAVSDSRLQPRSLLIAHGDGAQLVKENGAQLYPADQPMPVSQSGKMTVKVHLPTNQLLPNTEFHVCFLLGLARHCHPLTWDGAPLPPKKRRLWAVLVGVSQYGRPKEIADLRYAHNDAMDLAKLFADDFGKANRSSGSSSLPVNTPDYESISIDLFLAVTPSASLRAELAELAKSNVVTVHSPSMVEIRDALRRVAEIAGRSQDVDDFFIFYFSGHGMASPMRQSKGQSAFLLPAIDQTSRESAVALSSGDLLELLSKINAEKVIILDACRTLPVDSSATPFDPAKVRSEFENSLTTGYLMFSASPGQASVESSTYFFNTQRDSALRGNGVFTYTLLQAMTDERADTKLTSRYIGKITVDEAADYIEEYFLSKSQTSVLFSQKPLFVPARGGARIVLRTLDRAR